MTRKLTEKRARNVAVPLFFLAYGLSTALSSNTSWRYFGQHLDVTNIAERSGMFAVLEVMLLACTMGARANTLNSEKGSAGAPGLLVWVFAAFGAFPAYSVGGSTVDGSVRLVLGPVVSVIAFHLALGMELRHRSPGAKSNSVFAVLVREARERLFARLGLGTRDLTAQEISERRAVVKAAILSGRFGRLRRPDSRRGRRLESKLQAQLRRAGVAGNGDRADALLAQLAIARHARELSSLALRSPWSSREAVLPAQRSTEPAPPPEPVREPVPVPEPPQVEPEPIPELVAEVEPDQIERRELEPEPAAGSDDDAIANAEPPAFATLGVQAAVERADAILTGPSRTNADLAALLNRHGVQGQRGGQVTTAAVGQARRRAAERAATQMTQNFENVSALRSRSAQSA